MYTDFNHFTQSYCYTAIGIILSSVCLYVGPIEAWSTRSSTVVETHVGSHSVIDFVIAGRVT